MKCENCGNNLPFIEDDVKGKCPYCSTDYRWRVEKKTETVVNHTHTYVENVEHVHETRVRKRNVSYKTQRQVKEEFGGYILIIIAVLFLLMVLASAPILIIPFGIYILFKG